MTTEEFLKDVCPNHTDTSKWNKSELLHILELHTEQLRIHDVVGRSEQLKAIEKLKDFAYEVCPLHREDDLEEIVGSL